MQRLMMESVHPTIVIHVSAMFKASCKIERILSKKRLTGIAISIKLWLNKTSLKMAESARKQRESLKKELLVLIYHFLQDEALVTAAETLNEIASFDLSQFSVCDNIDLGIIVQEFQTFHQASIP